METASPPKSRKILTLNMKGARAPFALGPVVAAGRMQGTLTMIFVIEHFALVEPSVTSQVMVA